MCIVKFETGGHYVSDSGFRAKRNRLRNAGLWGSETVPRTAPNNVPAWGASDQTCMKRLGWRIASPPTSRNHEREKIILKRCSVTGDLLDVSDEMLLSFPILAPRIPRTQRGSGDLSRDPKTSCRRYPIFFSS